MRERRTKNGDAGSDPAFRSVHLKDVNVFPALKHIQELYVDTDRSFQLSQMLKWNIKNIYSDQMLCENIQMYMF